MRATRTKDSMIKLTFASAVALALLAGCNTVEGMGKDLKAGGKAIEGAASDAKSDIESDSSKPSSEPSSK